jgi:ribose 5-phosphate isomerase
LQKIPGVIANGIFTMKIDVFFKAKNNGTVEKIER